jgi:NTP pyrophosphatase (non-canonical NTP hydrolase)
MTAGHMVSEAAEVLDAIVLHDHLSKVRDELGDTLACLVHLCTRLGISPEDLVTSAINKLNQRFIFRLDSPSNADLGGEG